MSKSSLLCPNFLEPTTYSLPFSKGEKVTVKAHGGMIDIEGIIVARVNDALQLQSVEAWFDPMEMFRQISRQGGVVIHPAGPSKEAQKAGSETGGCPFLGGKSKKLTEPSRL